MGLKDWLTDIVSVPVEDEEEIVETNDELQNSKTQPISRARSSYRSKEQEATPAGASNIKVVLAKPESFEDGRAVADHLNAKRTVVLNLESANREISRRLIDFLSGVAYANAGQLQRVANCTYIITPRSVDVMGDMILGELESSGLFDNV